MPPTLLRVCRHFEDKPRLMHPQPLTSVSLSALVGQRPVPPSFSPAKAGKLRKVDFFSVRLSGVMKNS